jgi:hypothetical protein
VNTTYLRWNRYLATCYFLAGDFFVSLFGFLVFAMPNIPENWLLIFVALLPLGFGKSFISVIKSRAMAIDKVRNHLSASRNPSVVTFERQATDDQIVEIFLATGDYESFADVVLERLL